MAQNNGKKRGYRVRYDRIIFCVVILVVLILLLTSCIRSCGKKDTLPVESQVDSLQDALETEPATDETDAYVTSKAEVPPSGYSTITMDSDDIHTGDLILVNTDYPCEFNGDDVAAGTSPDINFVTIRMAILENKERPWHYSAADWEVGLDRTAAFAMDSWFEGFFDATGNTDLRMIGGYRADAGDPDFRTGRTLTIGIYPESGSSNFYRADEEHAWLAEHAHEYGFILRYPEGKDDYFDSNITSRRTATFRYVGIAAATYMAENDLCLEEFLDAVKRYSIDSMLTVTSGSAEYGIYYIPANATSSSTSFSVPKDYSYTVSGNNMDGFIITVALNDAAANVKNATPDYEDLDG